MEFDINQIVSYVIFFGVVFFEIMIGVIFYFSGNDWK